MLVLHVRPRPLSAGLEVAVYAGSTEDEEGTTACMGLKGTVFAVPRTHAGFQQFISDLVAAGPGDWSDYGPAKLALPSEHSTWNRGWASMQLDLLAPDEVQATLQVGWPGGCCVQL